MFDKFSQRRKYQTLDMPDEDDNSGYLDGGVALFVGAIISQGGRTMFSCEGHPRGFMIVFESPASLVDRIREIGFFDVISSGREQWTMTLRDEEHKIQNLRLAGDAWVSHFGLSEDRIEAALRTLAP